MTLYDFNRLDEHHKAEAIWQGTFLADREENGLTLQLYSVAPFMWKFTMTMLPGKSYAFAPSVTAGSYYLILRM